MTVLIRVQSTFANTIFPIALPGNPLFLPDPNTTQLPNLTQLSRPTPSIVSAKHSNQDLDFHLSDGEALVLRGQEEPIANEVCVSPKQLNDAHSAEVGGAWRWVGGRSGDDRRGDGLDGRGVRAGGGVLVESSGGKGDGKDGNHDVDAQSFDWFCLNMVVLKIRRMCVMFVENKGRELVELAASYIVQGVLGWSGQSFDVKKGCIGLEL